MSPLSPLVAERALRRLGVGVAVWVWVCWLWLAGAGLAQAWAQSPQPAFRFKGMTDSTVPSLGPKVLSPEERQYIASLPVLRVAMQAVGAPPYEVVGADGQISGFQAELLARLAVPLGLRLKPVIYATWPEVLTALREGQADIVLTLKVTQQRLSFLEFTLGTVPQPSALFARVGTAVPVPTARIALEREYASNDYVARQFPKARIVPAQSTIEALRAVADGRADYYLGSLLEALDFLAHEPVPGIEVREILRTGTGHYHIGVRKALAPLAQILNKGITRERADTDFVQPAASVPGPLRELRLERALVPDAEQAAALARRAVWRVGAVRGLAMLNDADARGAHSGIAAEYTEHVASRIGVGVEVVAFDSVAEMLDALRSARIDFVPFLTPTPERAREFVFSTPYLEMPYMLLARSDAPLFWDLGSLRGKRLALALQHPLRPLLAQRYPEVQVVDARNGNEAMDMVARGDADAAVEVKLFANLRINGDPGAQLRVLAPVEDLPARFAFAGGPENASLIPLINRALAEVKPAEAERMLRRWVATDQDPPFPWRKFLPVLSVSVIALLTLIGGTLWWTRRLAREVQARRRADAQLDDVGRALPGVAFRYTIDPGTGFRGSFYSSGAEAFLGLTPVRDKPLLNLMATRMPPDQAAAALALQSACGRSGKPFHFTGQYQHPDGRALWLKVEVQQRRDVGGAVVWTGYIVDVSAEAQLQQRLSDEARERHLLLASASHELRAPTHTLSLALESITPEGVAAAHGDALRIAKDASRTLAQLLDDVLDAARIQAGHLVLRPQKFALASLIEPLRMAYLGVASSKSLAFECRVASGVPTHFHQDPVRLRQVLTNLLSNAFKYTQQGSVTLAVSMAAGAPAQLVFEVSDTGSGISAERQASLFEPFAGVPTLPSSSGLGLSICQRLVQAMGGSMAVRSQVAGGTQVSVKLPEARRLARPQPVREHGVVLLCDDDAVSRMLLAQALRAAGHSVVEVDDGASALQRWRQGDVRVLVTDLRMPGLDGAALIQAICQAEADQAQRTAIIVCSGDLVAPPEPGAGSGASLADAHLVKPVEVQSLRSALDALGQPSPSTQPA